jgi:LysM repeat protein
LLIIRLLLIMHPVTMTGQTTCRGFLLRKENPEMKQQTKIVLLVALALFLTLTACTRQASQAPVTTPSPTVDVPFPVTTPGLGQFGTQTAEALKPVAQATTAPEVAVATTTQTGGGGNDNQSGGGQAAPAAVATATQQPAQAPAITIPSKYPLEKGEWPICIARRFDLDISTFFAQNGLSMASKPATGVVLTIPANSKWNSVYGSRALKAHPASYTVQSGDTINTIACAYGDVAPEQILAVNGIKAEDIKSGVKLNIP